MGGQPPDHSLAQRLAHSFRAWLAWTTRRRQGTHAACLSCERCQRGPAQLVAARKEGTCPGLSAFAHRDSRPCAWSSVAHPAASQACHFWTHPFPASLPQVQQQMRPFLNIEVACTPRPAFCRRLCTPPASDEEWLTQKTAGGFWTVLGPKASPGTAWICMDTLPCIAHARRDAFEPCRASWQRSGLSLPLGLWRHKEEAGVSRS